ncbi:MAG: TRAP transporter small permease [Pelagibacterium sp.]|uniref:TRAP transporter small permease subunit n=1 Tax=Pelagibacterium sp. TaxID=1967288 RepID=UPI0032EF6609
MPDNRSMSAGVMRLAAIMKTLNRWIALICGVVLLVAVALILLEVLGRRVSLFRIGGADELSGCVMAGIATWGFAYALVERAHVRIDLVYAKLPAPGRAVFDILALASVLFVAALVSFYAFDVLSKSIERGSRSNTPLGIELWIPQVVWFTGWAWLTVTSATLLGCTLILTLGRQWGLINELSGIVSETGEAS